MTKNRILCLFMAALLLFMSLWAWFGEKQSFSESERRQLAQFPELSADSVFSGEFMTDFESYTQDQFPLRDSFRGLKSAAALKLFGQKENNGLYLYDGHIVKRDYPVNEKMLENAAKKFSGIYDRYLKGSKAKIYLSVIPDKAMFTEGHLNASFEEIESYMLESCDFMKYIDISDCLELDDYYRTDSHWKQEKIMDAAELIVHTMGAKMGIYELGKTGQPFYGVYSRQLALKTEADSLNYLSNDTIEACKVTSFDTGKAVEVPFYDLEAAAGRDPYEMFLNGADALIVIENPKAKNDRELVIFRDSFGSSLAPLLLESYSKVTLVDIRYVQSAMLGSFIDFDGQDVLFIYSTGLLNNSLALK